MKSKITFLALMAIGVLFAGCLSSARLNEVRVGMTKDEVIALLGTPDSTSAQANIVYLTYYLSVEGTGRTVDQPYLVRLVDGKVESFGRFAQLTDIYYRPPATNGQPLPTSPLFGMPYNVAPAPSSPSGTDVATQLQILKRLKDQGGLTDDEFQKAKAKLLSPQQ